MWGAMQLSKVTSPPYVSVERGLTQTAALAPKPMPEYLRSRVGVLRSLWRCRRRSDRRHTSRRLSAAAGAKVPTFWWRRASDQRRHRSFAVPNVCGAGRRTHVAGPMAVAVALGHHKTEFCRVAAQCCRCVVASF